MNVDRFTRGRQAFITWVALGALLLGVFVAVRVGASRGVSRQIDEAQVRGSEYAAVIGEVVESQPDSTNVAFNQRELMTLIQAQVFDDPTVAQVRLYGPDGVLLFATDQDVRPGDIQAPSDDPGVSSAAEGTPFRSVVTTDFTWSTVGGSGQNTELLQTFQPLQVVDRLSPAGVVQVDYFMDVLRAAAISSSDRPLTVIAVLGLLCLAAAVFTYRRGEVAMVEAVATDDAVETEGPAPEALEAEAVAPPASVPEGSPVSTEEVEELRRRLAEAETRAEVAEEAVATAQADASAARKQAERRAPAAPAKQAAATGASNAASVEAPPAPDPETLQRLEERIAAAEDRAREAEERIDQIAPLSSEASDLRNRLAKTAARKKLHPSSDAER